MSIASANIWARCTAKLNSRMPEIMTDRVWIGLACLATILPTLRRQTAPLERAEQRRIIDQVARRLRAPLTELASKPAAMGLIHADLLAKNVLFRADGIAALDFEYCGWGFYLYDLAPLLWQLKGERAADYPQLEDAMWRGYTSIRRVDEGDRALLETFIAARQIASIRWLQSNMDNLNIRAVAPSLIAGRCEELKVFLETGNLRRSHADPLNARHW